LNASARAREQQHVQQLLDQTWRTHVCPVTGQSMQDMVHMDSGSAGIDRVEEREVVYVSTEHRVTVQLPRWQCAHCQDSFAADPICAACWPSTPTLPSFLFSLTLMHSYASVQRAGLTMTGGRFVMCAVGLHEC
jgi:hypothetical protein